MKKSIIALSLLFLSSGAVSMDDLCASLSTWAMDISILATSANTPAINQSIEFEYNNIFARLENKYKQNLLEIPADQITQPIKDCVFVVSPDLPHTVWTGFPSIEKQEIATRALEHSLKQLDGAVFYKTTPIIAMNRKPDCSFAVKYQDQILILQAWPDV